MPFSLPELQDGALAGGEIDLRVDLLERHERDLAGRERKALSYHRTTGGRRMFGGDHEAANHHRPVERRRPRSWSELGYRNARAGSPSPLTSGGRSHPCVDCFSRPRWRKLSDCDRPRSLRLPLALTVAGSKSWDGARTSVPCPARPPSRHCRSCVSRRARLAGR